MPHMLCIGMGYTAQHAARRLAEAGWHITGTGRSAGDIHYQTGQPTEALRAALLAATHILVSIPPDEEGCPVLRDIQHPLAAQPHQPVWIGYLSSTAVYGDHKGAWVDEHSACDPEDPRSRQRLHAEAQWQARGAHIFRLAGIYGAGRNALEQVRAGTAKRIDAPGQFFSRIHAEDAATALIASMYDPEPSQVYNVADDLPAASSDVVAYACELLGMGLPPLVPLKQAQLSRMARSFYDANKRISNTKMKEVLGVSLRYPTYREGLRALLETGTTIA